MTSIETGTSDRRFLVADTRGSIIATTDASGAVLDTYCYGPGACPGRDPGANPTS